MSKDIEYSRFYGTVDTGREQQKVDYSLTSRNIEYSRFYSIVDTSRE